MKYLFKPILVLIYITALALLSISAQAQEKMVIALKTSDFELTETDISALAIGESKTIETGGKVIDLLKTGDGVEIYVDGELLEINEPHDGHMTETRVEIICEDGENCEEDVVVIADHDTELSDWMTDEGDRVIIHKEVIHACSDDEKTSCGDPAVRIDRYDDIDSEELHEVHEGEQGHKIIVIEKEILKEG